MKSLSIHRVQAHVFLVLVIAAALVLLLAVRSNAGGPGKYPRFQVAYSKTDDHGLAYYNVTSEADRGTHST